MTIKTHRIGRLKSMILDFLTNSSRCKVRNMAHDLKVFLKSLYDAGAEDVPATQIGWRSDSAPLLMLALQMGYIRYRDRDGIRYFDLTNAGYYTLGIEPPSRSSMGAMFRWLRNLLG